MRFFACSRSSGMGATETTGCSAINKQVVMLQPIRPSPTTPALIFFVSINSGISLVILIGGPAAGQIKSEPCAKTVFRGYDKYSHVGNFIQRPTTFHWYFIGHI